jgi:hypothetical protein
MGTPNMSALTIQLSDRAIAFLRQQATAEGFASADDYLAYLVAKTQEHVESALVAGLDSGPSRPMTAADWQTLRSKAG